MLVLSRKVSEQLMIGDDVVITVVSIDADRVRLGITAPRAISVDRAEVRARKMGNEPHTDMGGES